MNHGLMYRNMLKSKPLVPHANNVFCEEIQQTNANNHINNLTEALIVYLWVDSNAITIISRYLTKAFTERTLFIFDEQDKCFVFV